MGKGAPSQCAAKLGRKFGTPDPDLIYNYVLNIYAYIQDIFVCTSSNVK